MLKFEWNPLCTFENKFSLSLHPSSVNLHFLFIDVSIPQFELLLYLSNITIGIAAINTMQDYSAEMQLSDVLSLGAIWIMHSNASRWRVTTTWWQDPQLSASASFVMHRSRPAPNSQAFTVCGPFVTISPSIQLQQKTTNAFRINIKLFSPLQRKFTGPYLTFVLLLLKEFLKPHYCTLSLFQYKWKSLSTV